MVKGWILDLPIIPQPIVFLCIVLAAQPTLSWSLSDLDQWAHFSQYRGLCQQRLHILIVMHCKHQKSKMKRIVYLKLKTWRHSNSWMNMETLTYCYVLQISWVKDERIFYVKLKYMEAFKLLNGHRTRGDTQGWHSPRLLVNSDDLQLPWWRMQKDQTALLPWDSFTTHPVVDDQLTMASVVVKPCSIKGKASLTKIFIVLKNNQSPEPDKHFHVQYLFETTLQRVWVINTGHKTGNRDG